MFFLAHRAVDDGAHRRVPSCFSRHFAQNFIGVPVVAYLPSFLFRASTSCA